MVRRLGPVLHLSEPFMYIAGGFTYGFGKQFRVHEMRAGAGGQIAPVLYQLHASQVDFAVALDRVFNGISGLRKRRRVQDDHIVFTAFLLQPGKKAENIGTLKLYLFRQAVEGSVFPGLVYRQLRGIHTQHMSGPCQTGVEGKGTGVGKAVQHLFRFDAAAEILNSQPVVLLVQEEACFLTVLHIHHITDPIFQDFHLGVKGISYESLMALHSLLQTDLGIAALIYAPDGNSVLRHDLSELVHNDRLQTVDSQSQGFHHQHI